mmetsp:Transcript_13892/g.26688  ORF Transcript_13892/g.26688 Transcript_13892/m.26688 type:complete len:207 (-) Transcript_13892:590-1210(-)
MSKPTSRDMICLSLRNSGSSSPRTPLLFTMQCASPSAIAVFPTPGSPKRMGLFFLLLARICMTRMISLSRPMTGSNKPSWASSHKFLQNSSSTLFCCCCCWPLPPCMVGFFQPSLAVWPLSCLMASLLMVSGSTLSFLITTLMVLFSAAIRATVICSGATKLCPISLDFSRAMSKISLAVTEKGMSAWPFPRFPLPLRVFTTSRAL